MHRGVLVVVAAAAAAASSSPPHPDPLAGWRMVDRFAGFRYEVDVRDDDGLVKAGVVARADELACFGWIQDSPRGTLVGEARCAKPVAPALKDFLMTRRRGTSDDDASGVLDVHDYEDTKIKLHFSHFKILAPDRETCFPDPPHQCPDLWKTAPDESSSNASSAVDAAPAAAAAPNGAAPPSGASHHHHAGVASEAPPHAASASSSSSSEL